MRFIALLLLILAGPALAQSQAKIGPSFGTELAAAGLAGLPFSWGGDGVIEGRQNLTAPQSAALDAVIAAHDPTKPGPPPQIVSSMQAKVALSRAGILPSVQTWVQSQDAETQLIWTSAPTFSRGSALINKAAIAIGLSSSQVDALFLAAAAINP